MPYPSGINIEDYESKASDLMALLNQGTEGDPRRILTEKDKSFYDSLPSRFTVYRGCAGISTEFAAAGVCWTTRRKIAEWFAARGPGDPIVVTASVRKEIVQLVKATEFEVVCTPPKARAIKCRLRNGRPEMEWTSGSIVKEQRRAQRRTPIPSHQAGL